MAAHASGSGHGRRRQGSSQDAALGKAYLDHVTQQLGYLQQAVNFRQRLKGEKQVELFGLMSNWSFCADCGFR